MKIKKVISFEVEKKHYKKAPCVFWCFDDRFHGLLEKFRELLKTRFGISHIDAVEIAGGVKDLASPDQEHKLKTALWEIQASLKLHSPPWIGLMAHADCGAYGKQFTSEEDELFFYAGELKKAKEIVVAFLRENRTDIPVMLYYADFAGLYEIEG